MELNWKLDEFGEYWTEDGAYGIYEADKRHWVAWYNGKTIDCKSLKNAKKVCSYHAGGDRSIFDQ